MSTYEDIGVLLPIDGVLVLQSEEILDRLLQDSEEV